MKHPQGLNHAAEGVAHVEVTWEANGEVGPHQEPQVVLDVLLVRVNDVRERRRPVPTREADHVDDSGNRDEGLELGLDRQGSTHEKRSVLLELLQLFRLGSGGLENAKLTDRHV